MGSSLNLDKDIKKLDEQLQKNKEVADIYTSAKTGKNIDKADINKDVLDKARDMYNNPKTRAMGLKLAEETIKDLAQLILYQEIEEMNLHSVYDLVDRVNDGEISHGNAKEYIVNLTTGHSTWAPDMFNPTKHTLKKLSKYIIQMYDEGGALNNKAYQFKKSQTLQPAEWIPYFLSGKLDEYMNKLRGDLYRAYKVFKSNLLFDLITKLKPAKQITANATNMFDALTQEVIPNIEKMLQTNSEYNLVDSKFVYTSRPEDIIILMSTKNKSLIQTGIKTQLFTAQLLNTTGGILSPDNIYALGNKINVPNTEDEIITDTKQEWIDDNTIIVLDISRIKHVYQINQTATQDYASNITSLVVSHIWGAMDILPWCKCFVYKNNNLSKLPE